jgi:hypothetical protein
MDKNFGGTDTAVSANPGKAVVDPQLCKYKGKNPKTPDSQLPPSIKQKPYHFKPSTTGFQKTQMGFSLLLRNSPPVLQIPRMALLEPQILNFIFFLFSLPFYCKYLS